MFRKRMTRLDSDLTITVRFNNQEVKGTLTNISMNGIFSEMTEPSYAKISDLVEVVIFSKHPENNLHIAMECKIVRIQDLQYAFQLYAIDYDSLMIYKKLLADICGDESIIDEELMAFSTGFDATIE